MHLSDAANLMAPAYQVILAKGYSVRAEQDLMVAVKGDDRFVAENPVALLGVIALAEARAEHWQATDAEIAEFMALFG